MRKFLACLLLLVFMAPFAAQADEIIVGNGTTSSYNAPFNNFYKNSWNETIYPASGFMLPGTINTIGCYKQKFTFFNVRLATGK